ncbi:hypothetical protein PR202_ga18562 [Eleusine coracana subsp. coracana]|uniref:Protein kinase domain-containing protein n=1 Tax=Eleusine coracana subsp. coracana TaxID=191504 RepID=A0AAV5CTG4_ELECO|nr:hypothetical protein PR202_ga18562 [Eleusine coracana subsp. coracana]
MLMLSGIYTEKNIRLFSYAELRSATDNFNRTKKIGRGGFGTVYKGTIRNGREVAVKVLSAESRQGLREFLTEIDCITNVKHPNLVELIGGYLAPEYAWHGQLTKKADIYSFGVLVLEIVSGRSSSRSLLDDEKVLIEKAWEYYEAKRLKELVDPTLGDYPEDEVIRYIKVALFCVQAAAARRPSMPQVLTMLSKPIRINESELTAPGYINDYKTTVSKATSSSNSRFKNSGSDDSNAFSTVVPQTVSEMSPR